MDEIAHLSLRLQAKLLRVLQERRVRRLGGRDEIDVDVRVLAATSMNLDEEAAAQRFRMDLLYRIKVAHIHLPPLRARTEDIPLLAAHFIERYAREMGRDAELDEAALEVLCGYQWPGNIRELQNVVKRAIAMSRSPAITANDLPEELVAAAVVRQTGTAPGYFELREQHVAAFEKEFLERILLACGGNISQAAAEARLPRGTFYRLLNRHGIEPTRFR
jgi:DNA-binding NtrC family response regulator